METILKRIKVICAECGKIEYVYPSRAKRYNCCSTECMGKFNSKKYSQKVEKKCPICGKIYYVKQSKVNSYKTCGCKECRIAWLKMSRTGCNNSNYKSVEDILKSMSGRNSHDISRNIYLHVVKECLGLNSISSLPKGYVIHHKDANHMNNDPKNLVMIPKSTHRLIHTLFGNIMINALHTGKISREIFFSMCNDEQKNFYKEIIDLDITHQVVVKQDELLERPEEVNQHPSIYRNIIEGSTTNSRILTSNVEDSNADKSVLPNINIGDDIV